MLYLENMSIFGQERDNTDEMLMLPTNIFTILSHAVCHSHLPQSLVTATCHSLSHNISHTHTLTLSVESLVTLVLSLSLSLSLILLPFSHLIPSHSSIAPILPLSLLNPLPLSSSHPVTLSPCHHSHPILLGHPLSPLSSSLPPFLPPSLPPSLPLADSHSPPDRAALTD